MKFLLNANGVSPKQPEKNNAPLPVSLKKQVIANASVEYYEFEHGQLLSQHFKSGDTHLFFYKYFIDQNCVISSIIADDNIAFQFTIKGDFESLLNGQVVHLEQNRYNLMYVPEGIYEIRFRPGQYETIHLVAPSFYLLELSKINPQITTLLSRLHAKDKNAFLLPRVAIDYQVREIIKELSAVETSPVLFGSHVFRIIHLYVEALQAQQKQGRPGQHNEQIQAIVDEIVNEPDFSKQKLSYFTNKYHLKPQELSFYFRRKTGKFLSNYVKDKCLEKAMFLLKTKREEKIDAIAAEVGLDGSNFSKIFKKHYGLTPHQVRGES